MAQKIISTQETEEQKKNREMVEGIAKNISALADAVGSLIGGPLNRKALLVLLASSSGLSQREVNTVLTALQEMKKDWLR